MCTQATCAQLASLLLEGQSQQAIAVLLLNQIYHPIVLAAMPYCCGDTWNYAFSAIGPGCQSIIVVFGTKRQQCWSELQRQPVSGTSQSTSERVRQQCLAGNNIQ